QRRQLGEDGRLGACRRQVERLVGADGGRHRLGRQLVERRQAQRREHGRLFARRGGDMTADEAVVLLQGGEGFQGLHLLHVSGLRLFPPRPAWGERGRG